MAPNGPQFGPKEPKSLQMAFTLVQMVTNMIPERRPKVAQLRPMIIGHSPLRKWPPNCSKIAQGALDSTKSDTRIKEQEMHTSASIQPPLSSIAKDADPAALQPIAATAEMQNHLNFANFRMSRKSFGNAMHAKSICQTRTPRIPMWRESAA